jgi:hypothetical protein
MLCQMRQLGQVGAVIDAFLYLALSCCDQRAHCQRQCRRPSYKYVVVVRRGMQHAVVTS